MSSPMKLLFFFFFFCASTLFFHGTLGEIICEDLPTDICSLSIASSGKRCLLENFENRRGKLEYQCRTSEVVVEKMSEYIETDECIRACGVDRNTVGISSDALLEAHAVANLCSEACYQNCPNIIDLYFNLAAGEGVNLSELCESQRSHPHRAMIELLSSGDAALSPLASEQAFAPASAPAV